MQLSPVMQRYILHWGEMGARWGVNRSVAQIHALLYLAGEPLPADEICETLNLARSNVSNSLRELQGWELVRMTHVLGDRRDHFEAHTDTWDVFTTIVEQRKHREIDPTIEMLRRCVSDAGRENDTPAPVRQRIESMLGFMEQLSGWYQQMSGLPRPTLVKLVRLGTKVAKLVGR